MALYVAIEGTEIFKCEFGRFEVLSVNPLRFKLDVKNLGNVHIRPEGYAIFKNKKDGQKIRLELNVISAPILPNMELDIGIKKGDDGLAPGEYTAFIHLEYGKNGVLEKEFKSNGVRPTH